MIIEKVKVIEVRPLRTKTDNKPFVSVTFESQYSKYPLSLAMFDNFEGVVEGSEVGLDLDHDRYFKAALRLIKL